MNFNKKILITLVVICFIVLGLFYINFADKNEDSSTSSSNAQAEIEYGEETTENAPKSMIYVHVCGQVNNPGVYELESGSRVFAAIEMAGGINEFADAASLNLAKEVKDGEQIYVPEIGEAEMSSPSSVSDGLVNINTATAEELTSLPGIGQSRAKTIIDYRETNGDFSAIEDIMNVTGIKEASFAKIKDLIKV